VLALRVFLRRLAIKGFKSFADRTVFDFSPGVAVIVGPNGSGKSNLVDAIAWVLGEQGAKTLRGGKMEDVIFAGTPKRPALGRAEVELTIDNSSGVLPIDFTEVTISRTLFRTGESEYAINGVTCRLLDVQELLSDSGIGRELHTIIGQGQLDAVLSGSPADRRAVLEEASGLLKYRKRKEKAVRKLERVDSDIERLGDVIGELRRQIRPLERQAEVAKRASEIEAELRDVKLKVWVLDYGTVTGEEDAEAERRAAQEVAAFSRALAEANARVEALEQDLARASRASEAVLGTEYRLAGIRDRFVALARFAEERRRHLEDLAAREPRGEAPTEEEMSEADAAVTDASEKRVSAQEEARRAEGERAAVQSAREEAARAREEVVHLHGERSALRASVEGGDDERRRLEERRRIAQEQAAAAASGLVEVRKELELLEEEEASLGALLDEAEARRDARRVLVDEVIEQERTAERVAGALTARAALLQEEVSRLTDPAAILSGASGIRGRLHDGLRACAGYERALHAALGPLADAVVSSSRSDAVSAVKKLKTEDARVVIAIPGAPARAPVPAGLRSLGEVVESWGTHDAVARAAVAGIVLAETLDEAAEVHARHPAVTVVTTDGDVLGPSSIEGGAPVDARNPREELRRTAEDVARVTDALEAARRATEHARADLEVLAREVAVLDERMNSLDATVAGATERLGRTEADAAACAREDGVLAGRIAEVVARQSADAEKLKAIEERLSRAVSAEPAVDAATLAQIERMAADRALRLGEATERERAAGAALSALRERARRVAEERARWEAGRTKWLAGAARAALVESAARTAADRTAAWAEIAREERAGGEGRRRELEEGLTVGRTQRRDVESALEEARMRAHEADLRRAERSHRIAALVQKLRDEHDLGPEEATEAVRPDPEEGEELRRRASTLERRLGLLGRVNPIAMEQYQGMVDRHAFLTEQVGDLKHSRRDLMSVVAEVDNKVVEIFSEAFTDVSREFTAVFSRLFPGGEGKLTLTDPDDVLNTGIEVEARPAGKRVKRVSLLSGGERALTAVGLLFSVFRARPSPFYLLDEVEAALDDVNLHRFLALASEFRDTAQLLIVTHQKRTMEIGDALYGISMGSEGVSKAICKRLELADVSEVSLAES